MSYLFKGFVIENLDLSTINTTGVEDMTGMFCDSKIKTIYFGNFDTSKVTSMKEMFYKCKSLISLDLSSFNTIN